MNKVIRVAEVKVKQVDLHSPTLTRLQPLLHAPIASNKDKTVGLPSSFKQHFVTTGTHT